MTHNRDHIVVHQLAEISELNLEDRIELRAIERRVASESCSFLDAIAVVRIVWKYLRP